MVMLEREMKTGPEKVQQVKARTRAVLEKRLERYQKAMENRDLINAQTETIQEVLQLLRDQSYSMRDPHSISAQVDGLISSAEETERGVKDLEDILGEDDESAHIGTFTEEVDEELAGVRGAEVEDQASPPRSRAAAIPQSPPPPPRKKITH
jgi:hypothetical protein